MKLVILSLSIWPWTVVALYLLRGCRQLLPSGLWDTLTPNPDARLYRAALGVWIALGFSATAALLTWGPA